MNDRKAQDQWADGAAPEAGSANAAAEDRPELGEVARAWNVLGSGHLQYHILMLSRLLDRTATLMLRQRGDLSLAEWRVLIHLAMNPPVTVRELAESAWVDRAEVSRAFASMEARGLVVREDNPADGRSPLFAITRKGRSLHDRIRPVRRQFLDEVVQGIPQEDVEKFDRALERMAARAYAWLDEERRAGAHRPKSIAEA